MTTGKPRARAKKSARPDWLKEVSNKPDYAWAVSAWDRSASLPGAWFDSSLADAIVELWPKYFRHTEGRWAGKPFELAIWQAIIVRLLVGWKNAEGYRLFRRLLLWVARKNGKSEFIAALSLLFFVFDEEKGGQAYAMASNENQAKIIFEKAKTMVGMSPAMADTVKCYKKSMWSPELFSRYELLTGKAEGKHGLSASVVAGDEMHEWIDDVLYTTLHQSTAARDQPIELLGSTAGFKGRRYGWQLWEESVAILDGRMNQPGTLVVIFAAGPEDDWTDETVWGKANPNLGISPKIEYLRDECEKARGNPRRENDFRRYHLNQWTEQAVRWIPLAKWDRNTSAKDGWKSFEESLRGRTCYSALDLSATRDVTALVHLFPPEDDDGKWIILPRFYVPEDTIMERVKQDRVQYDVWAHDGALLTTEGNVVDQNAIKSAINADSENFDIRAIGYDPWNATKLALELQDDGANMIVMRQGVQTLGEPSKEFERLIYGEQFDHGGHPVLRWMVGNVAVRTDSNGNFKPDKERSSEKIDGVIGAVMALGLANTGPRDTKSVYETRGLLEVNV